MKGIVTAAAAYFAVVFALGFAFGTIRVPLLVPALGERYAELIEAPFMLGAIFMGSRFVVRRWNLVDARNALTVGILAAILLLIVEFTVVLKFRGLTLPEYFAKRDPIAGTVYYFLVLIYAAMPSVISRFSRS